MSSTGSIQFFDTLDELARTSNIVIDRTKGKAHPRISHSVYPVDYGYLAGTIGGDGDGIDVFVGTAADAGVVGVLLTADTGKRDAEIKLLLDCSTAGAVGFGSTAFGSSQESVAATPRLASVDNFRDVAGEESGYQGLSGIRMNRGVFYRSNALLPNDTDLATLNGLEITAVYDLRTAPEIVGKEDRLPTGATYTSLPTLSGKLSWGSSSLKTPADAVAYMHEINRGFVTEADVRASFATLFTSLVNTSGTQLVHCTAGKDRTGWISAPSRCTGRTTQCHNPCDGDDHGHRNGFGRYVFQSTIHEVQRIGATWVRAEGIREHPNPRGRRRGGPPPASDSQWSGLSGSPELV